MPTTEELPDSLLLEKFVQVQDQEVFSVLVRRHGPMVHGVCLRILGDFHEAQDVTQAVFVTLARKAASLRKDPSVAGWLHHVATCLSRDVLRSSRSRRSREEAVGRDESDGPPPEAEAGDFRRELDRALEQLPERYRVPLVLFHLENRSLNETADRLGLKPNTVGARLVRGREMLRKKLVKRGVGIGSTGALAALLTTEGNAALSAEAVDAFSTGWSRGTAGISQTTPDPNLSSLSRRADRLLWYSKAKIAGIAAAGILAIGLIGFSNLPEPYLVVDLSAGPSASRYPVSHMRFAPSGGWTDEYKTDKLVLRRLPKGVYLDAVGGTRARMKGIYAGVFEVTERQWELVMGPRSDRVPRPHGEESVARRPARYVSSFLIRERDHMVLDDNTHPITGRVGAQSFVGRLRARTGIADFDLPTTEEWRYAQNGSRSGRAADAKHEAVDRGNLPDRSGSRADARGDHGAAEVGNFPPDDWGLYDFGGNVKELCVRSRLDEAGKTPRFPYAQLGNSWVSGDVDSDISNARRIEKSGYAGFRVFMSPTDGRSPSP